MVPSELKLSSSQTSWLLGQEKGKYKNMPTLKYLFFFSAAHIENSSP